MPKSLDDILNEDEEALVSRLENRFILSRDPGELDDIACRLLEYERSTEYWGPFNTNTEEQQMQFLIDCDRIKLVLLHGYTGHFGIYDPQDSWNHLNYPTESLPNTLRGIRAEFYSIFGRGIVTSEDQEQYYAKIMFHLNDPIAVNDKPIELRYWEASSTASQAFSILRMHADKNTTGPKVTSEYQKRMKVLAELEALNAVKALTDINARREWKELRERTFNFINGMA